MDPESKLIHQRLEAWGRWAYDSSLRAYPRETVISKMIEYGPLGASQASKPPISMPDEIAAVDAAVARLCVIDRKANTAYYTREDAIDATAKKCRMTLRHFQRVLHRARFRLRFLLSRS